MHVIHYIKHDELMSACTFKIILEKKKGTGMYTISIYIHTHTHLLAYSIQYFYHSLTNIVHSLWCNVQIMRLRTYNISAVHLSTITILCYGII